MKCILIFYTSRLCLRFIYFFTALKISFFLLRWPFFACTTESSGKIFILSFHVLSMIIGHYLLGQIIWKFCTLNYSLFSFLHFPFSHNLLLMFTCQLVTSEFDLKSTGPSADMCNSLWPSEHEWTFSITIKILRWLSPNTNEAKTCFCCTLWRSFAYTCLESHRLVL